MPLIMYQRSVGWPYDVTAILYFVKLIFLYDMQGPSCAKQQHQGRGALQQPNVAGGSTKLVNLCSSDPSHQGIVPLLVCDRVIPVLAGEPRDLNMRPGSVHEM